LPKPNPYTTFHGADFWSTEHQARLRQMGNMTTLGPKEKSPPPWWDSIPAQQPWRGASVQPATSPAGAFSGGFGNGSAEPVRPLRFLIGVTMLAAPICAGIFLHWFWGVVTFVAAIVACFRIERFLESERGELLERMFNWTFGLSLLIILASAIRSPDNMSWTRAALMFAFTGIVVVLSRAIWVRLGFGRK
jgi:hypothetical protein